MENLLPPLLILLAVAVALILLVRAGAKRSKASVEGALSGGPDAAAAASARLTEGEHREVYSLIARGLTVQAVAAYREATGAGLVEARNAVILMDRYPQQFHGGHAAGPDAGRGESARDAAPAREAPAAPEPPRAVVRPQPEEQQPEQQHGTGHGAQDRPAAASRAEQPTEPAVQSPQGYRDEPRPQVFPYRYRAIVSNGRETLEVASNMLNDEIYNEIKALAQIGDAEDAAQMLRRHSDITIEDARAFVALL